MALQRPIWIPTYQGVAGVMTMLRITQGGWTAPTTTSDTVRSRTNLPNFTSRHMWVYEGKIFFPYGERAGGQAGWLSYNPRLDEFEYLTNYFADPGAYMIPIGDYVLHAANGFYQQGESPRFVTHIGGTYTPATTYTWAELNGDVFLAGSTSTGVVLIAYPFTAGASDVAAGLTINTVCAFKGVMYGLKINDAVNGCVLYEYSGGSFSAIGAGFSAPENADLNDSFNAANAAFFEFNDKLWAVVSYNTGVATYLHRVLELNTTTGSFTDRSDTVLPAAWKNPPATNNFKIFAVIDDAGSSRQVFLVSHQGSSAAGWECYEFSDTGVMPLVSTGAHQLGLNAGIIWDDDAQGCDVVAASDSTPSSYVTVTHRVSDVVNNTTADVDIRYKDTGDTSESPPYNICTEKAGVGSEGKIALASVPPSAPAVLTDLSDDFADSSIDDVLWEKVNPSLAVLTGRDYGVIFSTTRFLYAMSETAGRIAFGSNSPADTAQIYTGVGIKSRWGMVGAFQVDVTLAGLAGLTSNNSFFYSVVFFIKTGTGQGYGIKTYNAGVGDAVVGFTINHTVISTTTSAWAPIDGGILRIARDGADVWSMTADVGVANEDMLPAVTPSYTEETQIWLFGLTETASRWAGAAVGPGFSDIDVSGAGSVGAFEGAAEHSFMWDHITDLGAGFNGNAQLFGDTS